MTRRAARYQKRIEASARRAIKRSGMPLSRERVLGLRVQVMPAGWRWVLGLIGSVCLVTAFTGVPWSGNAVQGLEAIAGMAMLAFGAFGIRRTVSQVLETLGDFVVPELLGSMMGAIVDAFDP